MNKCKSLSDSSTSESEDDGCRNQHRNLTSFSMPQQISNKYSSTSESEDDIGRRLYPHHVTNSFQTGSTLKRKHESDEDDEINKRSCITDSGTEFKTPSGYRGTELSASSESEDRSSSERSIVAEPFFTANSTVKTAAPVYNDVSKHIMEKMGYVKGKGLGKYGQGITNIIEASKQRGRRGLGLHIEGLEAENIEWDSSKEQESVDEGVTWIPRCNDEPPLMSELINWMKEGEKKMTIHDETEFCNPLYLKNVLDYKTVFDKLGAEEMRQARTRSNPFETIRGGIFLNRAAMKMANMDAVFDFMFTDPRSITGESLIEPKELLYFADICAGPGGFSEYVLWRKKWKCKGFGFTLKGGNDFKLDEFFAGPPETFEPYYGVFDDGDIYNPENLKSFQNFVMENTDSKGVHFVMADGGFSVEGQENIQEILSKRLYLCQFLCALMILRDGGHFVCKLFDLFTVFSVGLVYLLYRSFEQVSIFKPNTSRPANSERYIICKWKKTSTNDVCNYLFDVNACLNQIPITSNDDICEVVPLDVIKCDKDFFTYIYDSNNIIAERQILHLAKIRAFAKNPKLHDFSQATFRKECLEKWKVPDKARAAPSRPEPKQKFNELLKTGRFSVEKPAEPLNLQTLKTLEPIFNFKAVICGEIKNDSCPTFYIGMGRSNVYYYDCKNYKWLKIDIKLEIPADTIFYGESLFELKGEGKSQKKVLALHVIDVLILGGIDVRSLPYVERMDEARMLAKAVEKPSRPDFMPLKIKQVFGLENIKDILMRLCMKQVKGGGAQERLCFNVDDSETSRHFIPSGMLIFNTVVEPWVTAFSKTHQKIYYFNTKTNKSVFERKEESAANFKVCFEKRIFWSWKNTNLLDDPNANEDKTLVHGHTIWKFIRNRYKNITGMNPPF